MKITKDTTEETRYYRRGIELEEVEPQTVASGFSHISHKGKSFLPDYAFARWDHGQPIEKISLRGHVLRKDGTPGRDRVDVDYITPADHLHGKGFGYPEAPNWLLVMFEDSPNTGQAPALL